MTGVEVDSLTVAVETISEDAAKNVEALSAALQSLRTSSASAGAAMSTLKSSLSGLGKLQSIGTSLKTMSGSLKATKADYSSLGTVIQNVSKIFASMPASAQKSAIAAAQAQKAMNGLGGKTANPSLEGLKTTLSIVSSEATKAKSSMAKMMSAFTGNNAHVDAFVKAFAALPPAVQRAIRENAKLVSSNNKVAKSYSSSRSAMGGFRAGLLGINVALSVAKRFLTGWITESNSYIENMNLFNVAMGEYAESARDYAEEVGEVMGIDPSTWMRNQGVFMTLATGFGVTADRAALMSKNLTQLGYDLSSFFNISVEDAMQKLQSGISGELEPLRRLGYDLSQARLEAVALSLGIDQSVASMSQAEKAQLRYYAIMTQVTQAQGDMARTLTAPANQLRIFQATVTQTARALGNIFIPALNAVLPYAIAFLKVIQWVAQEIAALFGIKIATSVDYSGITNLTSSVGDLEDGFGGAAKAAEDLKNATLGIDELNVISPNTAGGGGGGAGGGVGGDGFDFKLPEYDFLGDAVAGKAAEIAEKIKPIFDDILKIAAGIAAAFATWKIAPKLIDDLGIVRTLLGGLLVGTGVTLLIDSISDIIINDGITWENLLKGAGGGIATGAGLGLMLAKKLGPDVSYAKGMLYGAGLGLSIALTLMGITSIVDSGVDAAGAFALLIGASGLGAYLGPGLAKKLPGLTKGQAMAITIPIMLSLALAGINYSAIAAGDWDVGGAKNVLTALASSIGTAIGGYSIGAFALKGGTYGGVAGALIGFTIGLVANIILTAAANHKRIIDEFWASAEGQELQTLFAEVETNSQTAVDLKVKIGSISGELDSDTVANFTLAQELLDDIFSYDTSRNLTSAELDSLKAKIETFNSLGLGEIQAAFTETRAIIYSNKDALQEVIDKQIESAKVEALREGYIEAYKAEIQAKNELAGALRTQIKLENEYAGYQAEYKRNQEELIWLQEELKKVQNLATEDGIKRTDELNERIGALAERQIELNDVMAEMPEQMETNAGTIETYKDLYVEAGQGVDFFETELTGAFAAMENGKTAALELGPAMEGMLATWDTTIQETIPVLQQDIQTLFSDATLGKLPSGAYQNIESVMGELEGVYIDGFEKMDLTDEARADLEQTLAALEPQIEDYNKLAEDSLAAGLTVPENISKGLNDAAKLAAIAGDADAINYLIGQKFSTDPSFLATLATVEGAGAQMDESVRKGIANNLDFILDEVAGTITFISDEFGAQTLAITPELMQNMKDLGINIGDSFLLGAEEAEKKNKTHWKNWALAPLKTANSELQINSPSKKFITIGHGISDGLLDGINERKAGLFASIGSWARGIINKVKNTFDINSPSKVFQDEVGLNIGLGVAKGILDSESVILAAVEEIGGAIQKAFEGISYDPNIDYSELIEAAEAAGDIESARKYENIRNAKIAGEGITDWLPTYKYQDEVAGEEMTDVFADYANDIKVQYKDFTNYVGGISENMADATATLINKAKLDEETFGELWSSAFDFDAISKDFKAEIDTIDAEYGELTTSLKHYSSDWDAVVSDTLIGAETQTEKFTEEITLMFKMMADKSISAIQSIVSHLNDIPRNIVTVHKIVTESSGSISSSIEAFASGGFPDHGQLFIARESGPEWIGTIGGQTAVANNDQIEQGIEEAAYRGFARAIAEQQQTQGQQPTVIENKVYLDRKQLRASMQQADREAGASIMTGGVFA